MQTARAGVRASVLIPVKNGGTLLGEVLDAVLAQQAPWPFEVLVMDSGSSDGSVALARSRGVRVETVAPADFGHGRTRNRMAAMAAGDFLVFITQDARPASSGWLAALVAGCDSAPDVAGAFGPHLAHPGARAVTRRELAAHFAGFGQQLTITRLDDAERFASDPGYRQFLHFLSNNNSCLRRAVWQEIPFPDVMFAEDQGWALAMTQAGYAKAFVPEAAVYHSHDFGVWETLQRNFDEARSFDLYFDYRVQRFVLRALAAAVHLTVRDARWLRAEGLRGWPWLRQAAHMAAIEFARVSGQYLGTHHRRLPRWLLARVSRDQALQHGQARAA